MLGTGREPERYKMGIWGLSCLKLGRGRRGESGMISRSERGKKGEGMCYPREWAELWSRAPKMEEKGGKCWGMSWVFLDYLLANEIICYPLHKVIWL